MLAVSYLEGALESAGFGNFCGPRPRRAIAWLRYRFVAASSLSSMLGHE